MTIQFDSITREEISRQTTKSVKWSLLGNIAPRFITPFTTIVLTLLLEPADFGVVAASVTVISLAQIALGLGLGQAVVQRQTRVDEAASTAFWISTAFAVGLYSLLWVLSPWISVLYRNELVEQVVRVSGVSIFLVSLGSVPYALLQRALQFQKLFWVNLINSLTSSLLSVLLAFLGMGIWALVFGPLIGTGAGTILTWKLSGWRPALKIERELTGSLVSFGLWVVLAGLVSWFYGQADNALAGFYLGTATLGVYALGFNLSSLFPGLVISPLMAVAYPAFSAVQDDRKEVVRILLKIQPLLAIVLFPVVLGLSAIAIPGKALMYGDAWPGLDLVLQWLAIMGFIHLWSLNTEVFRAIGRPEITPKLGGINVLILVPLLIIAAPFGLASFTLTRLVGSFVQPLLTVWATSRVLGVSMKTQLRSILIPLGCALGMYVVVRWIILLLTPFAGFSGWLKLLLIIFAGASFYLLSLRIIGRTLWEMFLVYTRRILLVY